MALVASRMAHTEATRLGFEQQLANDPLWLRRQLQHATLPKGSTILIDTPPGPTVYLQQAYHAASAALAVILSDAASYATLPAMNTWISSTRNAAGAALQTWYVLNQVDPTDPLSHDVCDLLTNQLGSMLAPIRIHRMNRCTRIPRFQKPCSNMRRTHNLVLNSTSWRNGWCKQFPHEGPRSIVFVGEPGGTKASQDGEPLS